MSRDRTFLIGEAGLKALGMRFQQWTKVLLTFDAEKKQRVLAQAEQEFADMLFSYLVQLRGVGLKLAQLLCQDGGLLSPVLLETFRKSFNGMPPLSPVTIRSILRQELGDQFHRLENIDWHAQAAASLGQVHKAFDQETGRWVAVKVQYPGMDRHVPSDIALVRKIFSGIPNAKLLNSTLETIETQLLREIDYRVEATNQICFKKKLSNNVVIPEIIEDLCTPGVLICEWVDGHPFLEWLQTQPSREQRIGIARKIIGLFFETIFEHHINHGDPHPGNFLISSEHLSLVDFGASDLKIPDENIELYKLLLSSDSKESRNKILEHYAGLGAVIENSDVFYSTVVAPFRLVTTQFSKKEFLLTQAEVHQLRTALATACFHPGMRNFSPSFVYLHRALIGYTALLATLGVPVSRR